MKGIDRKASKAKILRIGFFNLDKQIIGENALRLPLKIHSFLIDL